MEADVGEVDVGEEAEQVAAPARFPHAAVRAADQGRGVPGGAQPAGQAAGGGAEGGVDGGEEPLSAALVEECPVQLRQDRGGREVLGGLGTQGVAGQGGDLGGLGALAAHVAHHGAPPRALGVEQVIEVAAHRQTAAAVGQGIHGKTVNIRVPRSRLPGDSVQRREPSARQPVDVIKLAACVHCVSADGQGENFRQFAP